MLFPLRFELSEEVCIRGAERALPLAEHPRKFVHPAALACGGISLGRPGDGQRRSGPAAASISALASASCALRAAFSATARSASADAPAAVLSLACSSPISSRYRASALVDRAASASAACRRRSAAAWPPLLSGGRPDGDGPGGPHRRVAQFGECCAHPIRKFGRRPCVASRHRIRLATLSPGQHLEHGGADVTHLPARGGTRSLRLSQRTLGLPDHG